MNFTMKEIVSFVKKQDIKFIRLGFCDILGVFKNLSIMPEELEKAFDKGIAIDGSAICGFQNIVNSDLLLKPDPSTMTLLPYRATSNRVMRFICDIYNPDGTPFICDPRGCLKRVENRAFELGYNIKLGAESEFYLFKLDEEGEPTFTPIDNGGYLDIDPLDKSLDIRREICLSLDEMGLFPESSHHEQGPGQNEIDFRYSDVLSAADNFLNFRSTVKYVSMKNGSYASFMPKPLKNCPGNGLHINLSLSVNGENIFKVDDTTRDNPAQCFMAGILNKAKELTAVLNPTNNSYERLGSHEAPKYIGWSHFNRSQYIRIPAAGSENMRMELRASDNAINPYLAFSALIYAGLDGIENKTKLRPSIDKNMYEDNKSSEVLPASLNEALDIAEKSDLYEKAFGKVLAKKVFDEYRLRGKYETKDYLLKLI